MKSAVITKNIIPYYKINITISSFIIVWFMYIIIIYIYVGVKQCCLIIHVLMWNTQMAMAKKYDEDHFI